jgi:hypothetical protein
MKDTRNERITQLYEDALAAMKKYASCEEYLSAEPEVRKPISVRNLSGFVASLHHLINKYECCIDDTERANVGTGLLYYCRSIGQYDCVEEDEK